MREIAKEIFEKYEIRKTKKQKEAFRGFVSAYAEEQGYKCKEEEGSFGARNIVVGNPDTARVIYTAHYDTAPRLPLPNFITPKNIWIYLLYQIVLSFVILLPLVIASFLAGLAVDLLSIDAELGSLIFLLVDYTVLILAMILLLAGPANKHTANDNTSGVTTLLCIMSDLPEELRDRVAFVFFDLEEVGLFGSAGFKAKHTAFLKATPIVNFDCVSDGDDFIFALRRGAKIYEDALGAAYQCGEKFRVEILSKGVFYPSDQVNFPLGIGVCALKRTKGGMLYMDRIHTSRDIIYKEENIEMLAEGSIRFAKALCS